MWLYVLLQWIVGAGLTESALEDPSVAFLGCQYSGVAKQVISRDP